MSWKSHRLLTVLLVLGLVLGTAACGGPTPTPEPTEPPAETETEAEPTDPPETEEDEAADRVLKVGVLGPLSGYTARYGEEMKRTIEMVMEDHNYQIGDYEVELVWIDSQAEPAKAAQAYEQAIVQEGIDVGIMNWMSSIAVACMEIAAKHQIPHFFGFGATEVVNEKYESDPEKYSYWMGKTWPSPTKLTQAYVLSLEDAIEAGKWTADKKVFICGEDTDYGRSFGGGMKEKFEEAGWEIVGEDYYPGGQTEFFPLLERIKTLGATVVAQGTGGAEVLSAFVKQADQTGLSDQAILIVEGLGWMGEWYELTGNASNYVLDQIPELASEEAQAWANEYREKYNQEPSPSAGGQTYDCINFFVKIAERALEKHGEITSETLYEVGQNELWTGELTHEGIIHEMYQYTPESIPDPVVGKGYYIFPVRQYMNGGSEIIWPEEWATGEMQLPEGLQ